MVQLSRAAYEYLNHTASSLIFEGEENELTGTNPL